eukprot:3141772-Prorocentrum_lima.AAC.1
MAMRNIGQPRTTVLHRPCCGPGELDINFRCDRQREKLRPPQVHQHVFNRHPSDTSPIEQRHQDQWPKACSAGLGGHRDTDLPFDP